MRTGCGPSPCAIQHLAAAANGRKALDVDGFDPAVLDALRARGHTIVLTEPHTSANSIEVTPEGYVGAADRRTRGSLAAGY
jgi:gamma-glutamyltranspeptidase